MSKILLRDDHHRETVAEALDSYLQIMNAGDGAEDLQVAVKDAGPLKGRDRKVLEQVVVELRGRSN